VAQLDAGRDRRHPYPGAGNGSGFDVGVAGTGASEPNSSVGDVKCILLNNIGESLVKLNRHEEAAECARAEIELARADRIYSHEAHGLDLLGDSHASSDPEAARLHWTRATSIFVALGQMNFASATAAKLQAL